MSHGAMTPPTTAFERDGTDVAPSRGPLTVSPGKYGEEQVDIEIPPRDAAAWMWLSFETEMAPLSAQNFEQASHWDWMAPMHGMSGAHSFVPLFVHGSYCCGLVLGKRLLADAFWYNLAAREGGDSAMTGRFAARVTSAGVAWYESGLLGKDHLVITQCGYDPTGAVDLVLHSVVVHRNRPTMFLSYMRSILFKDCYLCRRAKLDCECPAELVASVRAAMNRRMVQTAESPRPWECFTYMFSANPLRTGIVVSETRYVDSSKDFLKDASEGLVLVPYEKTTNKRCSDAVTALLQRLSLYDMYKLLLREDQLGRSTSYSSSPEVLPDRPRSLVSLLSASDVSSPRGSQGVNEPSSDGRDSVVEVRSAGPVPVGAGCDRRWQCSVCEKHFRRRTHAIEHTHAVHEGRTNCTCEICATKCSTKSALARHMRNVHSSVRRFACEVCAMSFYQRSDLSRHVKSRHAASAKDKGRSQTTKRE